VILSGTTKEAMQSLYARPHRSSINEPATIHDFNQDVLGETLFYLLPCTKDLLAASMACRAWKPVAQKLIQSRVRINNARMLGQLCGYRLNYLVFGTSSFQISTLSLDLRSIGEYYSPLIAQMVASSLSSLYIIFEEDEGSSLCHEILEAFFS
jgi:hypothetical protein